MHYAQTCMEDDKKLEEAFKALSLAISCNQENLATCDLSFWQKRKAMKIGIKNMTTLARLETIIKKQKELAEKVKSKVKQKNRVFNSKDGKYHVNHQQTWPMKVFNSSNIAFIFLKKMTKTGMQLLAMKQLRNI